MPDRAVSFVPGESPFHAKGVVWMGIRDFVEECVPGGVAGIAGQLNEPLREFLTQMFVPMGWYDIMPIIPLAEAFAQAMQVDRFEYVSRTAIWQAKRDMSGVYKNLLTSDTPVAICRRFASIQAQVYDYGKVQIVSEEPNRIEARADGLPEPIVWWWKKAGEGYLKPVLLASGAKGAGLTWLPATPNGNRHGVPLVSVRSYTTWL